MKRVYNFSAGPSMLPESVLSRAAEELLCYGDSGMSVMEMSHRSRPYEAIIGEAEKLLRELMNIPTNYRVLFLQGGASMQFAMVPLNLMPENGSADYVDSGNFASLAMKEAARYGTARCAASSKENNYTQLPALTATTFDPNAAYVHITGNNTIYGTRYTQWPNTGSVPLVCDLSSSILSEPVDVSKFGIIYAGAQKNMGPAGVTAVIIREDLIGKARKSCPAMLNYEIHDKAGSMYNTPPTYSIYMLKLVLEWLKSLGGLTAMQAINQEKAGLLYDYLDNSTAFRAPVVKEYRSMMNIPFVLPTAELDDAFIKEAETRGFVNLRGHRSVGGMRASIYNAMPRQGVSDLVAFMAEFEKNL